MWVNLRNNSWKPQNVSNFNLGNIIFFKRKYPERKRGLKYNINNIQKLRTNCGFNQLFRF